MEKPVNFAFVHGGGQGGWVWERTISALHMQAPPGTRALALDVPGCGKKRPRHTANLDNESVADDLIQDIEHAGLSSIVLVGHSQAGQVLPFMAAFRPDLFKHLVYFACALPLHGQSARAMMGTGRHDSNKDEVGFPFDSDTSDIQALYPSMFCNDMLPAQKAAFLAELGPDRWPGKTHEFTAWPTSPPPVPATFVLCLRDNTLPPAWQERFAERLGAASVIRVDAGHQVMITRPRAVAEILLQTVGT